MQVNIYVAEADENDAPTTLLILPFGPEVLFPEHLEQSTWRFLTTADADDAIIGMGRHRVEQGLANRGYVLRTEHAKRGSQDQEWAQAFSQ